MRNIRQTLELLHDLTDRVKGLEHAADMIKTVLIVKEPTSPLAANAYEGLRKQVIAAAGERRAHLTQLAQMDSALRRAVSLDDARSLVRDWMQQAGVNLLWEADAERPAHELFEGLEQAAHTPGAPIEVTDPAYVDAMTATVLRLGRARYRSPAPTEALPRPAVAPRDGATPLRAASEPGETHHPSHQPSDGAPDAQSGPAGQSTTQEITQ